MTMVSVPITGALTWRNKRLDALALRALVDERKTALSALPPCALLRFSKLSSAPFVVDLIACQELGLTYAPHDISLPWEARELSDGQTVEGMYTALPDVSGYVIPTSGSSGEPKLILGRWEGLSDYIEHYSKIFENRQGLRFAALTLPNFDPFLREIYTPLRAGHELHIPEDRLLLNDPAALAEWIRRHEIQVLHLVPTVARLLFEVAGSLPTVEFVMLAGEPLFWRDVALVRRAVADSAAIYNLYGPSETTLSKLQFRADLAPIDEMPPSAPVPIGKPLGSARAIVVGPEGPCGVHEQGEILIRHALPSHGYLRRTEGAFTLHPPFDRNPFNASDETPVYRTGDIGYLNESHDIVCIGRNDSVVKIRGKKVSMTRIEGAARGVSGVHAAIAQVKTNMQGSDRIVLFFTGACSAGELKQALRSVLSEFELPGRLVRLDEMPRTHSGKIARAALHAPEDEVSKAEDDDVLAFVRNLYQRVIGTLDNSDNPSFLRSGGQSIDAAQIVSALNRRFDCRLRLRDFFECDDAATVAHQVAAKAGMHSPTGKASPVSESQQVLPLLESQRRFARAIALRSESKGNQHRFQFPWACTFDQTLDVDRFIAAVHGAVEASWAMNVRFDFVRNTQEQLATPFSVEQVDLSALSAAEAVQHPAVQQAWTAPFELDKDRPVRAAMFRLADGEWLFVLVNHVLASDGTTRVNLLSGISARYGAAIPLRCRFIEYHQSQQFEPDAVADALVRLQKRPWPTSLSHSLWQQPVADDAPTRRISFHLTPDQVKAVKAHCESRRVSMAALMLHVLVRVQCRHQSNVGEVILISNARRPVPEDMSVVGCLTDSAMYLAQEEPLTATHAALMDTIDASEVSFLQAAGSLLPAVEPTSPCAFPVIFAPQPDFGRDFSLASGSPLVVTLGEFPWIWPVEFYPVLSRDSIVIHINHAADERLERFASALAHEIQEHVAALSSTAGGVHE